MGDPRKLRKKYSTPSHPWQKERIDEEKILVRNYGFKNKAELWKLNSTLSKFKNQVKELIPKHDENSELEKKELLKKLQRLDLISADAILEDILAITLKDLCERRLQTVIVKKGLARTIKQARQFIVHEHIKVNGRKITSPSYILTAQEEAGLSIAENSPFSSEDHPERFSQVDEIKEEMAKVNLKKVESPKDKDNSKQSAIEDLKEDAGREASEIVEEE